MRSVFRFLVVSAAVAASSGCTQFYNGSMGLKSRDHQTVQAYEEFKGTQAKQLATGPVQSEALAGSAAAGALGLYGQTGQGVAGRSSPLDGPGDVRRVTFTAEGTDFDPDADHTGSVLIYASTRHRDTADLYLKRVDGTAVTQLTSDAANEVMPAFSPDGQKVAFASDRTGNWDIYLIEARGGKSLQITSDTTDEIHPSFSADGNKLVYCSLGSPSGQWEMIIVDLASPATKQVIGHGLFPTWSPTEDRILFQRARQRGTRWFSIWTMDLIDGDVTPPTEIAVSSNAAVITPDWSPDGQHIVFCTVIDPGADDQSRPDQADLWIVNADGTGRTRLTVDQFTNLQPEWSRNGSIYFVCNRAMNGVENIWAMTPGRALDLVKPQQEVPTRSAAMVSTE